MACGGDCGRVGGEWEDAVPVSGEPHYGGVAGGEEGGVSEWEDISAAPKDGSPCWVGRTRQPKPAFMCPEYVPGWFTEARWTDWGGEDYPIEGQGGWLALDGSGRLDSPTHCMLGVGKELQPRRPPPDAWQRQLDEAVGRLRRP